MKTVLLLGLLVFVVCDKKYLGKEYRFDYQWEDDAAGWLKYHAVPAIWDEARLRCHAEGAVLASPLTDKLKEAIVKFVKGPSRSDDEQGVTIFTGVHATFSKGDYSSVEGVPLLRLAITWAPNEPDNYDNSESCLAMMVDYNGTVADTSCGRVLPYVCYKKDAQLTMTECGTTDPEYFKESRTGSCYKYHKMGLSWSEAYMTCVAEGGHLAIVNSALEARTIQDIISKNSLNEIFAFNRDLTAVGFHDWGHHGTYFMTIHGETLDKNYNAWAGGEPNNITRERSGDLGEFCGSVLRNVKLNDMPCNMPTAFLCEMTPNSLSNDYKA